MQSHAIAIAQEKQSMVRQALMFLLLTLSIYMLLIYPVFAASGTPTPMGTVLCAVVNMVYGNLGRGLATLAIIIVGVGATLGKVSWGLAITVGVGISVIFNAGPIANLLGSGISGC
ncbi:MAG: TrbC/VirB2 family protein [Alphaproteobacteria bacterium]